MSEQSNIYDRCRKRLTQKPDLKNLGPVILAESLFEFVGFQGGFVGFPNDFSSNMPVYYVKGGIP